MPKLSDYVSVTDAFAVFEEDFEGTIWPIASNSLEGAGVHDEQQAMSRIATPLDFPSVDPPSSWDDFGRVLGEIWAGIELKDVILIGLEFEKLKAAIGADPGLFAEAAAMAYSNYIKDQFEGYIELMTTLTQAIPKLLDDAAECAAEILFPSGAEQITLLLSDDGREKLERAKVILIQHVVANPKCEVLLGVVNALISLHEAWLWFKQTPKSEIWDEVGHVAVIIAEILRKPQVQERIRSLLTDPVKLGKILGTLVGIIIWEVIESVATAGLSKGMRFLKVVT